MQKHMYPENRKSINWFVGCNHDCVYCKPSFQRQMKRQGKRCRACYDYKPHSHLERLLKSPPKTGDKEFIFFPSSGDPTFASKYEWDTAIDYAEKYIDRTFLIQSKNPSCFLGLEFPDNVILATTIETTGSIFPTNPSIYRVYQQISNAPIPSERYRRMVNAQHKREIVTIEPILMFNHKRFVRWIKSLNLEAVYIGYDNHNCKLPEPRLVETQVLIKELEKFTEVRVKTLRKAWWE